MVTCDACGKSSRFPETIGELTLCKMCSLKILAPMWKDSIYTSNEEVWRDRDRAIKLARRSEFPGPVVEVLEEYFNEQVVEGLVKIFDGKAGQSIAIFEDSFSIDTQRSFNADAALSAYRSLIAKSLTAGDEEQLLADATESIIMGMVSGRSFRKSAALAGAGAFSEMMKNRAKVASSIPNPEIRFGEWSWRYSYFSDASLLLPASEDSEYGFIQLQKGKEPDPARDLVYFFKRSAFDEKELTFLFGLLCNGIDEFAEERIQRKRAARRKREEGAGSGETVIMQPQDSAPEELMKWKQLLDVGAITQDEYDAKKAQLLGL